VVAAAHRGRHGALGASFALGRRWLDVSGEAALGFDRLPDGPGPQRGGGGPAAILRATATGRREELEAALRYYGVGFANPSARPISQPDELDGQRSRDEVGGRLRGMLDHALVDDGLLASSPFRDRFRQDLSGWRIARWRPDARIAVRGRARYLHQGVNRGDRDGAGGLERSLSASADAAIGCAPPPRCARSSI
jgi:hypothetical protein